MIVGAVENRPIVGGNPRPIVAAGRKWTPAQRGPFRENMGIIINRYNKTRGQPILPILHYKAVARMLRVVAIGLMAMILPITLPVGGSRAAPGQESDAAEPSPPSPATSASTQPLPQDPFQRCAYKAVVTQEFGPLEPWQHRAYTQGLQQGITVDGKAWLTVYGPWEGRQGRITASGAKCSPRVAAANSVRMGWFIWLQSTPNGGAEIRQVLDCGAKRNDAIARAKGASLWADLWHPRRSRWTAISNYAVIEPTG